MNAPADRTAAANRNRLELLVFFDGIAIILIVLFHSLMGGPEDVLHSLAAYPVYLGLTLFTFSAGCKLFLNHADDIRNKSFLPPYFIRRFVRLYKPYLGYTLLMFLPVLVISYTAWYIFNLHFEGIATFFTAMETMNPSTFFAFFIGENPVTGHLWYLLALIIVTAVVFTILYFRDIRWLFYFAVPLFPVCLGILAAAGFFSRDIAVRSFLLLPFFILGAWFAFHRQYKKSPCSESFFRYFAIIFAILISVSVFVHDRALNTAVIYGAGIFFPFFLVSAENLVKKVRLLDEFIRFSGTYSFQIYLFHLPLILLILQRVTRDIFRIDLFFMPFIITMLAVWLSVLAYLIVKKARLAFFIE